MSDSLHGREGVRALPLRGKSPPGERKRDGQLSDRRLGGAPRLQQWGGGKEILPICLLGFIEIPPVSDWGDFFMSGVIRRWS